MCICFLIFIKKIVHVSALYYVYIYRYVYVYVVGWGLCCLLL